MGWVHICDSNQTETLEYVSQAQAENLAARSMIEACETVAPYCLARSSTSADLKAFLADAYFVRRNRETKKYWNRSHNDERVTLGRATAFAERSENTNRTEWVFVKNGRVVE
jgi:hypothetical protein